MNHFRINHLAVWVSVILMHVLGFLWYGPLFGEKWMALVGYDEASMQAESADIGIWIMNSVAIVASAYLLAWLLVKLGVTGIHAAGIGFLIAFVIHHLNTMNSNMFAGEPYGLAWITGGYVVASLTMAGFILGSWVKRSG